MLTFRKFAFRSSVAGSLALLSAALLHTSLVNSMSQSGSASALDSIADSAIAHVDSTISSISAELPYQIKAIPHQAGEFLSRNATTARLQFEGMKNSITAHLGSGAWLGGGASGWVKGGAQAARQATSKAPTFARKVPVVTGEMDVTRDRVNAVAQSVTNSSLGF